MKLLLSLITVLCCCVAAVHALQCYNCIYQLGLDSSQDFCREPMDESSSEQVATCTNGCLKVSNYQQGILHYLARDCKQEWDSRPCPGSNCDVYPGVRLCYECCNADLCNDS